ncbi:MAG: hypothetical protein ACT452_08485 [Microthrixaceae bacterium]
MRQLSLCLLAVAVLLAACGTSKGDGPGTTTTTTPGASTTTGATGTTGPTTSIATIQCADHPVSEEAADLQSETADLDGDGGDDTVRSYRLGEAEWHLNVALARGGGADLRVATYDNSVVSVLGGADVDGDGADELWARTGQGASATIIGLARLVGCELARVTAPGGEPAELPVGGSVGTASGVECDARVDPTADLTTYTATNLGDDRYEVRATEHTLDGTMLVERGTHTSEATIGDSAFGRATSFSCDDLSL